MPRVDLPVVYNVAPMPTVPEVLQKLGHLDGLILFESARRHQRLGRYSFLAAQPFRLSRLQRPEFGIDPFVEVRAWSQEFSAPTHPDLPPFQGGFAGMLSYDLGRCWERLPVPEHDEFGIPVCVIGMYDWVVAWDHLLNQCWIIAHGFPASSVAGRTACAQATCQQVLEWMRAEVTAGAISNSVNNLPFLSTKAAQHHIEIERSLISNFSQSEYLATVKRVIDYIEAGDIFQANLSQRLLSQTTASPIEIYLALREYNSAPFAGLVKIEDWAVLSSSPERFLQKTGNRVSTRPIKGTRQRRLIPEADLFTRDELRESQKDRAENVMIVDLLRNDLSRVCRPGTIRVPELCTIETYETVTHLVSEVTGELQEGVSFWELQRACFPGGSITGAPKIRAMEIITELEQVARGPYCGSLFYLGFDGNADSNLLIRTITQRGAHLAFPVGGGIVAQSNPQSEYEETSHKAAGIRDALKSLSMAKARSARV